MTVASSRRLALLAGPLCCAFLVGLYLDLFWLRLACKPVPILCLIAWVWGERRDRYTRLILAGLMACLVGDLLLEVRGRLFLAGLGAFLVGHVLFTLAFVSRSRALMPLAAVPCALWCGGLWLFLRPGLGNMAVPVGLYAVAIGIMMWRALACLVTVAESAPRAAAAAAGALLFGMSDSLIAIDRYHSPIEGARYPIILLFWLALAGIARSAAPLAKASPGTHPAPAPNG
jgi:uncharacterized membrane protein YhhN